MDASFEIKVNTEAMDKWLTDVRVLVSQAGFALDNYLVTRTSVTSQYDSRISGKDWIL